MGTLQQDEGRDNGAPPPAKALWIEAARQAAFREAALRAPRDGEILVESLWGAISRGTEATVFEGRVPASEHERMRGPGQEGAFPFPVKYGYAVVGRVAKGPPSLEGRDVFCLHPHQDRFVVAQDGVVPLPAGVPAGRAVLAANMETALNVLWDGGAGPADRICVVGGGLVGLLVAHLAAGLPGAEVTLVDVNAARAQPAAALGLRFALPGDAPRDCDLVVHCSASPAGLATAIGAAGFEARLVEASWFADTPVELPLGGAFHSRRLRIVASQVGAVPPDRRGRWSHRRRLEAALALLADERLDALISGETAFSQLAQTYGEVLASPQTLCHRIRYDTL